MFGHKRKLKMQYLNEEFKRLNPPKYYIGQQIYFTDKYGHMAIRSIAWVILVVDGDERYWEYTTNGMYEKLRESEFELWLTKQDYRNRKLERILCP